MNPALSVILFTTLSGTGFGLWFWLGSRIALGVPAVWLEGLNWLFGLILGAVLVAVGVTASLWHLGKPTRVWRAFSQWRTSWMSREGVFAIASFAVAGMLILFELDVFGVFDDSTVLRILAGALAVLSAAAVYSTAMIYASLNTIPAWRHGAVVPVYALFALIGGGLLFGVFEGTSRDAPRWVAAGAVVVAVALALIKRRYWRDIDTAPLPHSRGDAVGLPGREVSVFERPHTENNYLTREMGFVLARKHARPLRTIATCLFAWIPALCALSILALAQWSPYPLLCLAAISFQLGAMVERWLFFAEAKHVVTLYY